MTTTFRHLVSKQKRRFQEDGFDLDLSYVTNNIIAMGFPSEDNERFYRNPYSEVIRFLDKRHKDKFKIYNLCSERGYDPEKFYNRVGVFAFDDHNAPRFELIEELCIDIKEFLAEDPENVAVIHCKAGKGRTGLMICCWLLYNGDWETSESAQQFYAAMRTKNQKGVTIPSQIRYIKYFEERMKMESWDAEKYQEIGLKSITLNGIPKIPKSSELKMTLFMEKKPYSPWKPTEQEKETYRNAKKGKAGVNMVIDCGDFPVIRDVKIQFDEKKFSSQEVLCTFWFNTLFIRNNRLHLEQPEIDRANKDKQNRIFPEGFSVDIEFGSDVNDKGKDEASVGNEEEKGNDDDNDSQPGSKVARSATLIVENEDGEPVPVPSRVSEPLNLRGGSYNGEVRHPCEVAIELLDKAIQLYKHCLPKKATHMIDRYAPKRAGDHEKDMFLALETATSELNQVSLNKLEENDLVVFWLNTLNLMYLHSFIVYGPPNNTATREKILKNSNYSIAGLVYPLVVVEQIVILGNLPKPGPSELGGLKLPKIKLKEKDGRKAFQLKNPSNLLYFGIAGGAKCLPILTVFRSPETVEEDLKKLVRIAFSKVVVKSQKVQNVPLYLSWYRKNFGKKDTDMVEYLAKVADLDLKEYKEVGYEEYPEGGHWAFGSFFLHYQRDVSLEEGWAMYQEMEDQKASEEKDAKKADLLAQLEEIDELEEIDGEGDGEVASDQPLASSSPVSAGSSSSSTPDRGPTSFSSSSNVKGGSKKKLKKTSSRKFKGVGGSKTSVGPDSPKGKKSAESEEENKKDKKDKKKEKKEKEGDGDKKDKKKKKEKEGKGKEEESGKEDEERVIPAPPTDIVSPPEE